MTKFYYRLNENGEILNVKPKTQEEVDKIMTIKERASWTKLFGKDEGLVVYQMYKKELKR